MAKAGKLTLFNPHVDDFVATPVSFWLVGRRGLRKYRYLLDEPIRRGQRISILVDGTLSSLLDQAAFMRLPAWLRTAIAYLEVFIWVRLNDLSAHVDIHRSAETVGDRSFLYVFSYKSCVGAFEHRRAAIAAFDHAIVNLSHYFIRTREKADNIAKLTNARLQVDCDHSRNPYFRNFFPQAPAQIVLPFAVNARFTAKKPLAERDAKCAATGSFHNLEDEEPRAYYRDFIDFFHIDTYHPVRKLLYARRNELASWLACRIAPYRELDADNTFSARVRRMLGLDVVQADYFSFDIVEFYNQHRFAIVGEELSGAPAIGFFEAMACGCVMLGAEGTYYDGLKLEPGVHYLVHDGSVESIRDVIAAASAEPSTQQAMARAGLAYIEANCTPQAVWDGLEKSLMQLAGARLS
jgi:hypothetical protein